MDLGNCYTVLESNQGVLDKRRGLSCPVFQHCSYSLEEKGVRSSKGGRFRVQPLSTNQIAAFCDVTGSRPIRLQYFVTWIAIMWQGLLFGRRSTGPEWNWVSNMRTRLEECGVNISKAHTYIQRGKKNKRKWRHQHKFFWEKQFKWQNLQLQSH